MSLMDLKRSMSRSKQDKGLLKRLCCEISSSNHSISTLRFANPGAEWGQEVPLGEGKVDFPAVIAKLKALGYLD